MQEVVIPKGYFPIYVGVPEVPEFLYNWKEDPVEAVKIVPFQACLTFFKLQDKRVLAKDAYGRTWSIYVSSLPGMIPFFDKGTINGMWKMAKKGAMWGLVWLGQEHMVEDLPNTHNFTLLLHNIPLELLNGHLNTWQISPELEAMSEMTDFS